MSSNNKVLVLVRDHVAEIYANEEIEVLVVEDEEEQEGEFPEGFKELFENNWLPLETICLRPTRIDPECCTSEH